jgi:hypothetical protein
MLNEPISRAPQCRLARLAGSMGTNNDHVGISYACRGQQGSACQATKPHASVSDGRHQGFEFFRRECPWFDCLHGDDRDVEGVPKRLRYPQYFLSQYGGVPANNDIPD